LLLQIRGPINEQPRQALPPAPPVDVTDLNEDQAKVHIAATSEDDALTAMGIVSSGLTLVGEPIFGTNGEVAFTVARS
jgi:hypothetical protein